MMGAALGWLVIQKKLQPAWLGIAMIGLVTKPQAGVGLALLYVWWIGREQGIRPLILAAIVSFAGLLLTLLIWPGWIPLWLDSLAILDPAGHFFNAALFPYGLVAIPVALLPRKMPRRRRARMVAAATLLSSPYFASYHPTTLMTMHDRPLALLITYTALLPAIFTLDWQGWGWIVPALLLLMDAWQTWHERKNNEAGEATG
jgi:hypothetical protein